MAPAPVLQLKRFLWGPRFWFIVVSVLALVIDQVSKWLVRAHLTPHVPQPVIGETLRFVLTGNKQGIFGISYGPTWMHYVLPLVVVVLVVYLAWKSPDRWFSIALGLVLGGGLSNNFIDRVLFGSVVDFIDFGVGNWRWYTFNLADAFAVAGVIMILAHETLGWGRAKPPVTAPPQATV